MKTWAIVVGVLIVLFCLSYLVQHPSTVDQTFAKVFPHNGAETPVKIPRWCACAVAARQGLLAC